MDHIAIDLGGKESQVCRRSSDGTIIEERRYTHARLKAQLKRWPPTEGRVGGRPPKLQPNQVREIHAMVSSGRKLRNIDPARRRQRRGGVGMVGAQVAS